MIIQVAPAFFASFSIMALLGNSKSVAVFTTNFTFRKSKKLSCIFISNSNLRRVSTILKRYEVRALGGLWLNPKGLQRPG